MPPERRPAGASRRSLIAVLGFLVAAILALVGQRWIAVGAYPADGVALLVAGGALLLLVLLRRSGPLAASLLTPDGDGQDGPLVKPGADPTAVPAAGASAEPGSVAGRSPARRWPWLRRSLLAVVAVSALVAFEQAGGGLFRPLGVAAWLLAIGSFFLAFGDFRRFELRWLRSRLRVARDAWRSGPRIRLSWELAAFLAIWLLGCCLLFYRLPAVPEEMISDHAEKLLDVKDVLDGQYKIFFERNTGREAVQFYLSAVLAAAGLGLTFTTLKTGTALVSAFAIPAIYAFTRVWFGVPVALSAAFLLAVSRWHLTVARAGLRFTFLPVLAALTGLLLLRALRYRQRNDFLLLGFVIGVGMHTYVPFRIIPLAVIVCLWIELMLDIARRPDGWERARRTIINAVLAAVVALLVFLPLGRFALERPAIFWYRGVTRISSAERPLPGQPLAIFLGNVKNASLMFNYRGDTTWNSNVPHDCVFDYVTGAGFFLGAVYALYRLLAHRERIYGYLLVLLFVALLPSTLSLAFPLENPSTTRSGMALPIAALIAALPVGVLVSTTRRLLPPSAAAIALTLALVPLGAHAGQLNFQRYFVDFARSHKVASQNTLEVARAINGFAASSGDKQDAWLKVWPHWVDTRLVAIQIGQPLWRNGIDTIAAVREHDAAPGPRLYVLSINDHQSQAALALWYPHAVIRDHRSPVSGEVLFRTYLIPPVVGGQ